LLAEYELLAGRGQAPLFLLDDVLSELDERRRRLLLERIRRGGQTFVTATSADSLPAAPDQLIEVTPGAARVA
jgi:DNA replication and repair protein RecF